MRLTTILVLLLVLTTAAAAGGQIATSQGLTGGQDWRPASVAARLADRFQPGNEAPAGADCRPVCTATATAIRNQDPGNVNSNAADPNASPASPGDADVAGEAGRGSGDPGVPAGSSPDGNPAEGSAPAADALAAGGPGSGSGDPSVTGASSATGNGNGSGSGNGGNATGNGGGNGNGNGSGNGGANASGNGGGNGNGNGSGNGGANASGNGGGNGNANGDSGNANGNNAGDNGKATGRPDHAGGPDNRTAPPPGQGGTPPGQLRAAEAQSLIASLNAERREAGLPPLKSRGNLAAVAGGHAGDMAGQQALTHTSSDGRGFAERLQAGGVSYSTAGENVAAIAAGSDSAQIIVDAFMASALHRANVLNDAFDEVGVAVFQDEGGRLWITVVFAG